MRAFGLPLLVLFLCLGSTSSHGQPMIEPDDVVLSGNAAGSQWSITAEDFVAFDVFVVGFDMLGGVSAVEWGLIAPADWSLYSFELPRAEASNIGTPTNVITTMAGCLDGSGATVLGHYRGAFLAAGSALPDQLFCLGSADPSSFDPPEPGYVECGAGALPVPFRAAQGGQGIYPEGCLVVNPSGSHPCPSLTRRQDLQDVFAPAGATATVGYRVLEGVSITGGPAKTICSFPSFTAVEFTIRFDPAILEWLGARLPSRYADFPLSVTVVAPGEIQVGLGPDATSTPLELHEPPLELLWLDFVMGPGGGTDDVDFDAARLLDDQGVHRDLDPVTILLSDDPGLSVETASIGAIKARF